MVTLTSPSLFLEQAMVKVPNDAVPHVAGEKREGLYEKDPQIAEGHLPAESFLVALGRWKSPYKTRQKYHFVFLW